MSTVPVDILHMESEIKLRIGEALKIHAGAPFSDPKIVVTAEVVKNLTEALYHITKLKAVLYKNESA